MPGVDPLIRPVARSLRDRGDHPDHARPGGRPVGMTASSVASVSLEPPLVLVSWIGRTTCIRAPGRERFVLNVLARTRRPSRAGSRRSTEPLRRIGYRETVHGIPVLEGVLASIECEKQRRPGRITPCSRLVTGGAVSDARPCSTIRRLRRLGAAASDRNRAAGRSAGQTLSSLEGASDIARLNALFGGRGPCWNP